MMKTNFKQKLENLKEKIENPSFKLSVSNKVKSSLISISRGVIVIGLCFIILYPILQMLVATFKDLGDLNDPTVIWIPKNLSIITLKISANAIDYLNALKNTVIVSFLVMMFTVTTCALAGYTFAKLKFKGQGVLFACVLATLVVPAQTISMPLYLLFNYLGISNSMFAVILLAATGIGIKAGIFIFIFRQIFRNLPKELEEAAIIDGCGVFQTFFKVMLPNARGAIVTTMLFSFVWQWNDVFYSTLLIDPRSLPLLSTKITQIAPKLTYILNQLGIDQAVAEGMSKNPLIVGTIANSAALLMMLPLLIAYIFVQKLFVESVERSGIVG